MDAEYRESLLANGFRPGIWGNRPRRTRRLSGKAAVLLSDLQIERYSRHIILPEVGGRGQRRLLAAHVAVAGSGAAAETAALYLGAAGVGTLRLLSSGRTAAKAVDTITALNPDCRVQVDPRDLRSESTAAIVSGCDIVVAAVDVPSLLSLNDDCVELQIPLVAVWAEGESMAVGAAFPVGNPCLRCAEPLEAEVAGILAPAAGSFAGTVAALEALKMVLGIGRNLSGRVLLYDDRRGEVRERTVMQRRDCPACGKLPERTVIEPEP